jgi:long-chain fatty acid transport protein
MGRALLNYRLLEEELMKRTSTRICSIAIGLSIVSAATAWGAGFRIGEQGARAMGMGNAFVAQSDDPSVLAFNPAGMVFLKGCAVSAGSTSILVPQTKFTGTTRLSPTTEVDEKANGDIFLAPTIYLTATRDELPVSIGFAVNSFFPLAKRWDAGSAFRDSIQELAIKPINFQPTIGYRYDPWNLGVAAGLDIVYAMVSLQKMAYSPLPPTGTYTELGMLGANGTATGFGYNLGAQWKPTPQFTFGVAYRSQVKLDITGDANYRATTAAGQNPALGLSAYSRSSVTTDITLPDILSFGIALKPTDKLTLEIDADRTGWHSYDKLQLTFGSSLAAFNNKPDAKNWKDVWAYRLGAQYNANKILDLRLGYAYDNSPVPDSTLGPELPDSDRHNFTTGFSIHSNQASFDLAYMWVLFADRSVSNTKETGTFKSDAHLFAANMTYRF